MDLSTFLSCTGCMREMKGPGAAVWPPNFGGGSGTAILTAASASFHLREAMQAPGGVVKWKDGGTLSFRVPPGTGGRKRNLNGEIDHSAGLSRESFEFDAAIVCGDVSNATPRTSNGGPTTHASAALCFKLDGRSYLVDHTRIAHWEMPRSRSDEVSELRVPVCLRLHFPTFVMRWFPQGSHGEALAALQAAVESLKCTMSNALALVPPCWSAGEAPLDEASVVASSHAWTGLMDSIERAHAPAVDFTSLQLLDASVAAAMALSQGSTSVAVRGGEWKGASQASMVQKVGDEYFRCLVSEPAGEILSQSLRTAHAQCYKHVEESLTQFFNSDIRKRGANVDRTVDELDSSMSRALRAKQVSRLLAVLPRSGGEGWAC